jgi:hypothetical protein
MNTLRILATLGLASALFSGFALAGECKEGKQKEAACCSCGTDKAGKACGVDKDCCCSGKKAEKKDEKKS